MKVIISLFIIFINTSLAQLSISISGGFDPKEISLYNQNTTEGYNAYWNNGITFGINCDYSLSEKLMISGIVQYSQYTFDRYADLLIRIPEIIFVSAEGEQSKFWRTSIEAKFFPLPEKRFKFFILSGIGIVIENFGTIKTQYFDMFQDGYFSYTINSENKTSLVHSLGLGVRTNIISNIFVDVTGLYYSDYSERFQTFMGLSIGYKIF